MSPCEHVTAVEAPPSGEACEGCGSRSSLRACTTCGHVGCCESQRGHNTAHFRGSGHPVIREVRRSGKGWLWCYVCRAYVD